MRLRTSLAAAVTAGVLTGAAALTLAPAGASATPPTSGYTITIGSSGSFAYPTDTPATPYIDKDGSFYFQQSASLYGATDPRYWDFYSGTDMDTATRNATISNSVNPSNPSDKNNDTTWRCNNSPTGLSATSAGSGSGYSQKNYCDLLGTWVDPDTGDWYGLVHNEFTPQPFGDGLHYDAIDYAVSHDQGRTWSIQGHAITSPYSTNRNDSTAFPNQTYYYGDGDQRLFVDYASGYFYIYYGSRVVPKGGVGGSTGGLAHVARAPLSGKMAAGTWQKWYNGTWTQPGVGGLESNMEPTDSANPTGYTLPAHDYNPANTGTVDQQVAAGLLPSKSPLFVMNITYDAYLGLYIGEPETVGQTGSEPQQYYVTDDLATQKWYHIGDSGSYVSGSWYRWFLDGANKTNEMIVGKTFRSYCSIACANNQDGTYADETVDSASPAAPPVDTTKAYTIGTGAGRVLAQVSGSSATTSDATATGSALEAWKFTGNGDGSYRITNAGTGQALGVAATAANRAWGTKPTVSALSGATGTVGQQWFAVPVTGQAGAFRLVNRYSGLVLALSSTSTRTAETTPLRGWTDTSGSTVGGGRTAAEQTLVFRPTTTPAGLNGPHTLVASGKALDDPNHSTTAGTQLITWTPNGGANQTWVFTQQADGSYQIVNQESQLCMDDDGGATTPGTAVIQWTCTGNSNQHWTATKLASGAYTLTNVHSGLLLTTASTTDGALVTQQTNSGSALQQWAVN